MIVKAYIDDFGETVYTEIIDDETVPQKEKVITDGEAYLIEYFKQHRVPIY